MSDVLTGLPNWLIVPLAPLLAAVWAMASKREPGLLAVLAPVPALLLALFPSEPLTLTLLWPGASLGLVDSLGQALLAFSALLWGLAGVYALTTQKADPRARRFWVFWSLALTGNLLLIVALDSISFYIGFTLMSLSAYGLVAHLPGTEPRQAGRIYLQLAVLGEMLLYAGLILRLDETSGVLTFSAWAETPIRGLTAGLLLVGLGLKAGFWPLHLWLPQAHPAAPPAASAILSGAMLKAGILGLWRFFPDNGGVGSEIAGALVALGLFSAFYGAFMGVIQTRAKVVLAYSSISQVGYLLIIVALAWHQPEQRAAWALLLGFYAAHHGFAKGALFLGAGLAAKGGLRFGHWLLLWLPALALAGLPLSTGVAVKTQLKILMEGTEFAGWLLLLSLGAVATTLVVSRALWLMRPARAATSRPRAPAAAIGACLLLALAAVLLPWLWPDLRQLLLYSLSWTASWAALWPLLAGAVLVAAATRFGGGPVPDFATRLRSPARGLSLVLKRCLQPPSAPTPMPTAWLQRDAWRPRERRWNRFWQQGSVTVSAWLLSVLLLLGWLW